MHIVFLSGTWGLLLMLISVCQNALRFGVLDKKRSKTRFLKSKRLLIVNDSFKKENNAEISEAIHEHQK